ncbi:hypothetical protein QRX50_36375 [Amycolatopsis carbonis]|uniref:Uncharacterized protein n=1 Tax=Amycolatopsis carbonis TaxID=715471 RepID=A0A9Y2ID93_9PSEU|nr:hypothetical protein [Amycolatopsis sp. 2-15]WIX76866.1 hypothetical protein QRX50_36375 [Amycolatopsis sp. 2-15]
MADGVDHHVVHPMRRDHDGAACRADHLVAGGLHQDRPVPARRERDRGLDISRALRHHHDHRGHQLVVQVEDGAFFVVSRVTRQQNRTRHHSSQGRGFISSTGGKGESSKVLVFPLGTSGNWAALSPLRKRPG